jgi:hypothetical protein
LRPRYCGLPIAYGNLYLYRIKSFPMKRPSASPEPSASLRALDASGPYEKWIWLGILLVGFLIIYPYTFDHKLALLGDNASYYMLGKALATGEGYVSLSSPERGPHNHYPPGYPAIIAGIYTFFPDSIQAVKIFNGLCLLASISLVYLLVGRLSGSIRMGFVVAFLCLINTHLLWYGSIMMSEVPFLLLSLLVLWAALQVDTASAPWKSRWFWVALVLTAGAYYLRSLGVALVGGVALNLLLRRHWGSLACWIGGFVGLVLPWFIRGQKLGGGSYINQLTLINPYNPDLGRAGLGDYVARMMANLKRYITIEIPHGLFPSREALYNESATFGMWVFGFLLIGLVVYGIVKTPRFRPLIAGYLLGTFGILMLWPDIWNGVRFMLPVVPLVLYYCLKGMFELMQGLLSFLSIGKRLHPAIFLVIGAFQLGSVQALHHDAKAPIGGNWANYFEIASWIKSNTPANTIVACGKPELFYVYSGTPTFRFKFTRDDQELLEHLKERKADYVVIDQVYGNTVNYLLPAVQKNPDKFEVILQLQNPETYLLKFHP